MFDPATPSPIPSSDSPTADFGTPKSCHSQRYTFTPRRLKTAPRPWERKAATPFAPRSESHKIWKRCEPVCRKNGAVDLERWRSVKRLRLDDEYDMDIAGMERWRLGYFGTMYEESEDDEVERPRKIVHGRGGLRVQLGESQEETSLQASQPESEILEGFSESAVLDSHADVGFPSSLNNHERWTFQSAAPTTTEADASRPESDGVHVGLVRPCSRNDKSVKQGPTIADKAPPTEAKDDRPTPEEEHANTSSSFEEGQPSPLPTDAVPKTPLPPIASEGDDTEYLHAFLTRARAKKTISTSSPGKNTAMESAKPNDSSPWTRSRTALATLDGNSPSCKKITKFDLPVPKLDVDDSSIAGINEVPAKPTSRKSSRTRQARVPRLEPAATNSIPFRRSNGTEFIFLQKTEAQQIAIATRSNTRKNKGEALEPKIKLERLSVQTQPSPVKSPRRGGTKAKVKQVSWDEELAYTAPRQVQCAEGLGEEVREEKTPVKRNRRLAPGQGTPAPKKQMVAAALDIGTSTPRARTSKRTRTRTRNKD